MDEVGSPCCRCTAAEACRAVAVYTQSHDTRYDALLSVAKFIASGDSYPSFDRAMVGEIAALIDRRTSLSMSVTHGEVYISIGTRNFTLGMVEHRIQP